VKKIEGFVRHEAFEAIRIRSGEEGQQVLQAHTEEEIAAGAQTA
jgi:hypothetical protein